MITITGGSGKSIIVEKILTKDTLLICMDPIASGAFANSPCPVFTPDNQTNATEAANILSGNLDAMLEDNTQIVFYSNLCMEHIAPFRIVLQEYEKKTRIPVILVYKGNVSAYPPTRVPLSERERVLASALMEDGYKSLDELIRLFWSEKYGSEGDVQMDIIITDIGECDAFYHDKERLIGKKAKVLSLISNGEWYMATLLFDTDPIPDGEEEILRYPFVAIKYRKA